MPKRFKLFLLLFVSLAVLPAMKQGGTLVKERSWTIKRDEILLEIQESRAMFSAHIYSAAPATLKFSGGQEVAIGPDRTYVYLREGWNDVEVRGKDIHTQNHRIFYDKNSFLPSYYIALRPAVGTPGLRTVTITTYPYFDVERAAAEFASSCQKLEASTPQSARKWLDCSFKSLREEIMIVGPYISQLPVQASSASARHYRNFFEQLLSYRAAFMMNLAAEKFHRLTPHGSAGYEAVALSSLMNNDCYRVHVVDEELSQLELSSVIIQVIKAICYELAGDNNQAAVTYQKVQNIGDEGISAASATYHLARWQARTSLLTAEKTLQDCAGKFPWYVHCINRLKDIAVAKGKYGQKDRLHQQYLTYAKSSLVAEVSHAMKLIGEDKKAEALARLEAHPLRKVAFSIVFLATYLKNTQHGGKINRHDAYQTRVVSTDAARAVFEHIITADEKPNPRFLERALQILVRDGSVYRKDYLAELMHHLYSYDRCSKVIHMALPPKSAGIEDAYGESVLEMQSRCYISRKEFKKAYETLIHMQNRFPTSWKPVYRLAELYVAKEDHHMGLKHYRLALSHFPPEEILVDIYLKISEINDQFKKNQENRFLRQR